jgi:hypothetical protein
MFLHISNFIALVALVIMVACIAIGSVTHTAISTKKNVEHSISQKLDRSFNSVTTGK